MTPDLFPFHLYLLVKNTDFIAYHEMGLLVYQSRYSHEHYLKELKGEL